MGIVGGSFFARPACDADASANVAGRAGNDTANKHQLNIEYIRTQIPTFDIPPYRGQSYEDKVPETLDIAERARLGLSALTSIPDPEADYEIYWTVDFFRNPPAMAHAWDDWIQYQEGFAEALPLLRVATGDNQNAQVDAAWMATTLKSIGQDGLLYIPLRGRPWALLNASQGLDPVWRPDGSTTHSTDPMVSQFTNVSVCARMIGAMTIYYLRDRNPVWKTTIEKMIDRLSALAINKQDYCYFAPGIFEPNAKVSPNAPMPTGSLWGVSWNTRLIQGLAQCYAVSGYEPARSLAQKLVMYTRFHGGIFDEQGQWLLDPEFSGPMPYPDVEISEAKAKKYGKYGSKVGGHGPGHLIGLLSVLDYAVASNDRELLEFSKSCFEWARSRSGEYGASTLVGWFPELFVPGYPAADDPPVQMVAVALKLTAVGVADYWDDIDRWVRNHVAEQQLTPSKLDDIRDLAARSPQKPVAWNETADHVIERNTGAFSSGVSGNDWALGLTTHGITQCCTGNGTRALYYIWEHMLQYSDGQLVIHLLLNRASRWADVYSYIPYEGRVDLKIKLDCRGIMVRTPQWLDPRSPHLCCSVDGVGRAVTRQGRYIEIGSVTKGTYVTLTFPIAERTVNEKIGPATYTLVLKGTTVVSIDPPGKNVPLYQERAKYRKAETRWTRVARFVPADPIAW
jgi:hypothetical protein